MSFSQADTNGDGVIDRAEWRAAHSASRSASRNNYSSSRSPEQDELNDLRARNAASIVRMSFRVINDKEHDALQASDRYTVEHSVAQRSDVPAGRRAHCN